MSLKTAILSEKHSLDFSKRFSPFLTDVSISRALALLILVHLHHPTSSGREAEACYVVSAGMWCS